jgi:glucose/arabinose dehydrogenase
MNRVRVITRLALLGLIVAMFFIAKRSLLDRYSGTEPIRIDDEPAAATFENAFSNLMIERPIFLTFPPDGTNRIAVISQFGSVLIFPNDPGVEEAGEMLNIRKKVSYEDSSNEDGLLGLAFHPQFKENRQFFVYYTTKAHVNVLSRFEISVDDPNRADPASEVEIFRSPRKQSGNHNGGTLIFGPDGYLYMALGDGGPVNDPSGNGQNVETVLGKTLRIDVDHQDPGLNYAIPKDNPFVGRAGARGEIWALGLRNVWRMAFDRQSKRLWAGDVGEDTWEEIDIIERGGNYGWNTFEGFRKFIPKGQPPPAPPAHVVGKLIDPIFAYNHSIGNCIVGGAVYRGKNVPELFGAYLFADYVTGHVYALRYDERSGEATAVQPILGGPKQASMPVFSFGEDEPDELYFMTSAGVINRFVSRAR